MENCLKTLLASRLAAPIAMIAAGTSAPITIAAFATPANQSGKYFAKSSGTIALLSLVTIPAASAQNPSNARKPSSSE